jgi:ABC-type nitrate/sulfonate/bicarbonate transport system ATPase subunit
VTLNPGEEELKAKAVGEEEMRRVMKDLELERFIDKPVSMLSNGQSRRARIAKALLGAPEMLCLDAPFSTYQMLLPKMERECGLMKRSWSRSYSHEAHFQGAAPSCGS